MNEQFNSIIISAIGFIIVTLLGGNIYYVKSLIGTIKSLEQIVNEHRLTIETEKVRTEAFRKSNDDTHELVNTRLNAHSSKLADHDQRLTILDERIKNK